MYRLAYKKALHSIGSQSKVFLVRRFSFLPTSPHPAALPQAWRCGSAVKGIHCSSEDLSLVPILDGSQQPATPAPGDPTPLLALTFSPACFTQS